MKKSTIISIVLIIAAGLIGYGLGTQQKEGNLTGNGQPTAKEPIKIGVIASLAGTGASRGESAQQGLELALKKINNSNAFRNQQVKLVYQSAPITGGGKEAISAFRQLTASEKVIAVIGPMGSNTALAVVPLVDKSRIPTIIHTASVKDITQNNDYVFRIWPTDKSYAQVMAPQIKKYSYKKIAVLSTINDNTIGLFDALKKEIENMDAGISFVIHEQVAPDVRDYRTQLTKIKAINSDALFLNLFEEQIGTGAKQAIELGIQTTLFTNSVMSEVELKIGAEALEGIWFPEFLGYNEQVKQEFIATYRKESDNPDSTSAAHDALIVLAQAISTVGTDSAKIKDYLYNTTFTGSIGDFNFNQDGDAELPLKIQTVKNGQIVDLIE